MQPEILYEDEQLLVLNKPAGLLTLPDRFDATLPSLQQWLSAKYERIFTVHRLDRETSGVIVFAKDAETHQYLNQLFENHTVAKYYWGIVLGKPTPTSGTIDAPIAAHPLQKGLMVIHAKGKPSVTDYEVLEPLGPLSLVQYRIHTGRTHQVRVHSKHIGHPLACDALYGDGKPVLLSSIKKKYKLGKWVEEERPLLNRVALHAHRLQFTHATGKTIEVIAELPKDMRALLQQLRKNV